MNYKIFNKTFFIFISFMMMFMFLSSQDSLSSLPRYLKYIKSDSSGIDFSRFLTSRTFFQVNRSRFTFKDLNNNKSIYISNTQPSIGLGLSYRRLTINTSFNIPYVLSKKHQYGETSNFSFDMNFVVKQFSLNILINNVEGFYRKNSNEFFIRPDLKQSSINLYLFKNKLNSGKPLRMIYFNDALIKKSEHSILAGVGLHFSGFKGDSSISYDENGIYNNPIYKVQNYGAVYLLGYNQCWIIKKDFYLVLAGLGGGGLGVNRFFGDISENYLSLIGEARYQVGAGFNSYRFQIGSFLDGFTTVDKSLGKQNYVLQSELMFKIVVAYRFLPKWLKKVDPFFDEAKKIQKRVLK